ncbi:MAG: GNAT family N-acetyltransferase [Enterobacterales bacterium]|nr:GNAT family N-acetyltransferase [Enterobacterales bacterium]
MSISEYNRSNINSLYFKNNEGRHKMTIQIVRADYHNPNHAKDLILALDSYAQDPMGGSTALTTNVKQHLIGQLQNLPHAFSLLAYADNQIAGLANCFQLFSTFSCKPIINIHDLVVLNKFRGRGISQQMLEKVVKIATGLGCCKITLEVLSGNEVAKSAYRKFGFKDYELDPNKGSALFWEKTLV